MLAWRRLIPPVTAMPPRVPGKIEPGLHAHLGPLCIGTLSETCVALSPFGCGISATFHQLPKPDNVKRRMLTRHGTVMLDVAAIYL